MVRLIRASETNRNDAEIFAGLVHSCRYAGLLEASMAAHEESRRLDPKLPTSIPWTLLARTEYEKLSVLDREESTEFDMEPQILALALLGRREEGRRLLDQQESQNLPEVLRAVTGWVRPFLDRDLRAVRDAVEKALPALYERWPAAAVSAVRSARHCGEAAELLAELADGDLSVVSGDGTLDVSRMREFSSPRQRNLLRRWLTVRGLELPDARRTQSILDNVLGARRDRRAEVRWPGGSAGSSVSTPRLSLI